MALENNALNFGLCATDSEKNEKFLRALGVEAMHSEHGKKPDLEAANEPFELVFVYIQQGTVGSIFALRARWWASFLCSGSWVQT